MVKCCENRINYSYNGKGIYLLKNRNDHYSLVGQCLQELKNCQSSNLTIIRKGRLQKHKMETNTTVT